MAIIQPLNIITKSKRILCSNCVVKLEEEDADFACGLEAAEETD